MAYTDYCKGCSASVRISSEEIKNMINEMIDSRSFKLVSEDIYFQRLEQCSKCAYLDYGTTCVQCGCIIQVRALLEDKDCPYPRSSRWIASKDR